MPAPKPSAERRAALAAGMARVATGEPMERAARAVGVPRTTLSRWVDRCYAGDPDTIKKVEDVIVGQAMEIATAAGAELAQRVPRLDDGRLVAAWGTAIDKIAVRRGWARGIESFEPGSTQADALARMIEALDGKVVRVSVRDLAEEEVPARGREE